MCRGKASSQNGPPGPHYALSMPRKREHFVKTVVPNVATVAWSLLALDPWSLSSDLQRPHTSKCIALRNATSLVSGSGLP